jgi:hypothetical protein
VKLKVSLRGIGDTAFESRVSELRRRLRDDAAAVALTRPQQSQEKEVSDGKRVLGAAAGDRRGPV